MTVQLNHTIVWCTDRHRSATFLAEMLGLPDPAPFMDFLVLPLENGVSMDFMEKPAPIALQHYAFLVDDATFDAGLAKIAAKGLAHWADPARRQAGAINRHWGGRGVYFEDPDGHLLELITQPYGSEKDL